MIDDGEADWKVIAIAVDDPLAPQLNSIEDVHKHFPNKVKSIVEWFKYYKVPDGKPVNEFIENDKEFSVEETKEIIRHTHDAWKDTAKLDSQGLWYKK